MKTEVIMHVWTRTNWKKYYNSSFRTGLRFVFEENVDSEVRSACKDFGVWLRKEYYFPIRVPVYVKASKKIKAKDGELVTGTFFEPYNREHEPYIRTATGDYNDLLLELGRDDALAAILASIAHELTHYYQWINDIKLTEVGVERQATSYSVFLVHEYSETREHP